MQWSPQIDHIGVAVTDADRSLPFYTERLGMRISHDEEAAHLGLRLLYLDAGNVLIQLVQPLTHAGPIYEHLKRNGEGLHHICLAVPSIPPFLESVGDVGRGIVRGGRSRDVCFLVAHPPGVEIELTELEPGWSA